MPNTGKSKTRPIQIRNRVDDRDGFLIADGEPSSQTDGDGTTEGDDTDTLSTGDSNIPDPPGHDQPDTIPGDWPQPFPDEPDPTDPNTPTQYETAAAYCFAALYKPMESPLDPEVWGTFANTIKQLCDEGNQPPDGSEIGDE